MVPHPYIVLNGTNDVVHDGGVIEEILLTVFVNGGELATMMCSPIHQEELALGFLYNEGVINSLADVGVVQANPRGTGVDIILTHSDYVQPRRMVLTSGCGGGITFNDLAAQQTPLESDLRLSSEVLYDRMSDLQSAATLYNHVRGVHTTVLGDAGHMLLLAEDVGRHNTIDKIAGMALRRGMDTRDKVLIASGRISSEMLGKARRLGVPIVASRTAPTSTAVQLASAWNITVVGYLRKRGMRVYTHPWRLGID